MFSTLKNRTSDADKDSEESGSKTAEINYEYILPTISDANPKEAFAIRIESHITALELFNVSNSNPKKSIINLRNFRGGSNNGWLLLGPSSTSPPYCSLMNLLAA